MKKVNVFKSSIFLVIVALVLVVAGCSGPKAQPAQLPDGFASATGPNMSLDAYLYAKQGQAIVIPGMFVGLPADASVQSVQVWVAPSDATGEAVGAAVSLAGPQEAQALFALMPNRNDMWKQVSGNVIYAVLGTGNEADSLRNALSGGQFVPLADSNKDGWEIIQRLPGPPASVPIAVGFARTNDRLLEFVQKHSTGGQDQSMASAVKLAKIDIAAAGIYSNRPLQIGDLMSPGNLKDAGAGGILIAHSSFPGFVISAALGPAASSLNLEKTTVNGKDAYYVAAGGPNGQKAHVYISNAGQYVYAEAAADMTRAQELFGWLWGSK